MSTASAHEAVLARVHEIERELRTLRTFLTPDVEAEEPHADTQTAANPEDLLLCRVAQRTVAVALDLVTEVLPVAQCLGLPEAGATVLGALNLRGTPLVVHDLAQRLTGERSPLIRTDLILACECSGRRIGLKIADAMDVVNASVTPMEGHGSGRIDSALLRGAIIHDDEQIAVLDVGVLTTRPCLSEQQR